MSRYPSVQDAISSIKCAEINGMLNTSSLYDDLLEEKRGAKRASIIKLLSGKLKKRVVTIAFEDWGQEYTHWIVDAQTGQVLDSYPYEDPWPTEYTVENLEEIRYSGSNRAHIFKTEEGEEGDRDTVRVRIIGVRKGVEL